MMSSFRTPQSRFHAGHIETGTATFFCRSLLPLDNNLVPTTTLESEYLPSLLLHKACELTRKSDFKNPIPPLTRIKHGRQGRRYASINIVKIPSCARADRTNKVSLGV